MKNAYKVIVIIVVLTSIISGCTKTYTDSNDMVTINTNGEQKKYKVLEEFKPNVTIVDEEEYGVQIKVSKAEFNRLGLVVNPKYDNGSYFINIDYINTDKDNALGSIKIQIKGYRNGNLVAEDSTWTSSVKLVYTNKSDSSILFLETEDPVIIDEIVITVLNRNNNL